VEKDEVTTESYVFKNLTQGQSYNIKVTVTDSNLLSTDSDTYTFKTKSWPDPVKINFAVTPKWDTAYVTWDTPSGGTTYNIYRQDGVLVRNNLGGGATTVHGLTPETSYTYVMTYVDLFGRSITSDPVTFVTLVKPPDVVEPPSKPTIKVFTTDSRAVISWESTGATSYVLYRDGEQLTTLTADQTQYADTDLSTGRLYTYVVEAVNNVGATQSDPRTVKLSISPDMSSVDMPLSVPGALATATSFLSLLDGWVLFAVAVGLVPIIIFVLYWVVNKSKKAPAAGARK
ncbi:hypothetical protein KIH86_15460, partial [Paenibacillus sp. HN-1]|uniref:fibronectin type III domain-containing protein n=4 Tax=Paenibacillus TaxID=44249 RepID=UPI001CA9393B